MSLGEELEDELKCVEAGGRIKDDLVCLSSMALERPQWLSQLFYTRISASDILVMQIDLNGLIFISFVVGSARTEEYVQRAVDVLCAEAELTIGAFDDGQRMMAEVDDAD